MKINILILSFFLILINHNASGSETTFILDQIIPEYLQTKKSTDETILSIESKRLDNSTKKDRVAALVRKTLIQVNIAYANLRLLIIQTNPQYIDTNNMEEEIYADIQKLIEEFYLENLLVEGAGAAAPNVARIIVRQNNNSLREINCEVKSIIKQVPISKEIYFYLYAKEEYLKAVKYLKTIVNLTT